MIEVFIDFFLCVFTFLQVTFGISTASTTTPTLLSRETKIIVSWSGALCQIRGLFLDKNVYEICRLLEGCSHPIPVTSGRGVRWLPLRLLSKLGPVSSSVHESQDGRQSGFYTLDWVSESFILHFWKVTLQNLFHDGGFSNMGVSQEVMEAFEKGLEK